MGTLKVAPALKTRLLLVLSIALGFAPSLAQSQQQNRRLRTELKPLAIIGDAGHWNKNTHEVRNSIGRARIPDLLMPGDNLYDLKLGYKKVWSPWTETGFQFPIVAIGNHTASYEEEVRFFNMPGEFYSRHWSENVKFIVLNSDNKRTAHKQLQWANEELKNATEKLVFIVYHHPSLTISDEHKWQEREEFQIGMRALLKKYRSRITAVLNGHDHFATVLHFDDLPVYVSGAAHEFRDGETLDERQEGVRVKTAWMFRGQSHWLRLDLDPENSSGPQALLTFIRASDDKAACTTRVFTGRPAELGRNCKGQ